MKRIIIILLLAVIFSLIALYFIYPELIEKVWLWLVGLLGIIIAFVERSARWIKDRFNSLLEKPSKTSHATGNKMFMQIFRYSRSGNRIFGLVFVEGGFVGMASEDSTNPPGLFNLNIKDNRIILTGNDFNTCLIPKGMMEGFGNNILFTTDPNHQSLTIHSSATG